MKAFITLLALATCLLAKEAPYTPTSSDAKVTTKLTSFSYNGREVPLKIYFPAKKKAAPLILLSHGLGGSREVGAYLGTRWANAGYVVVAMQHIGSDRSVWQNVPTLQRLAAITKAASVKSYIDRTKDVSATLDQLEKWNKQTGHPLAQRMDLENIGIAGHSFGALTTQALVGQTYGKLGALFVDKRIDAGFAMSPGIQNRTTPITSFSKISVPMLLMTGTMDQNFITKAPPESRLEVFKNLSVLNEESQTRHYQLVFKDAEHGAFSDRPLPGEQKQNPKHHQTIKTISTAFWDSALKKNAQASNWLNGKSPTKKLEKGDTWAKK